MYLRKVLRTASVFFFLAGYCLIFTHPVYSYIPQMNFEELVHLADIVFVGTVTEQSPKIGKNRRIVETDVVFNQVQMLHRKDDATEKIGNRITLTYAGGIFNEAYTRVSDMPRLEKGRRYLIFAHYDGQEDANPFVGGNQGIFPIMTDEVTGRQYPLNIKGSGIDGIREGKIKVSPPLKKIKKGTIELQETPLQIKRADAPQAPGNWRYAPRSKKAGAPGKILDLDEMIGHIREESRKQPSDAVLEKIFERKELSRSKELAPVKKTGIPKKHAWEFSTDGKLIILDPTKVKCPDPATKTTGDDNIGVQENVITYPDGGTSWQDIFINGWADLPVIMEMLPESSPFNMEDTRALSQYNLYIDDMIHYRERDGGVYWLNAYSEFFGFMTDAQQEDVFGKTWGSAIARTWRTGGKCESCEIFETDISFRAETKWTNDFLCQLYRNVDGLWDDACKGAWLYRPVSIHELGHTLGLMCGNESYDYEIPTVMNGGLENAVDNGRGLHVGDTYLLRYWYADQRNDADMNHDDIGIESWIAQGGTVNATTDKTAYAPGEQVWISNITIENPGRHAAPDVRVRAFLSNDTDLTSLVNEYNEMDLSRIPADRLMIGPPPSNEYYALWPSLEHEAFWTGDLAFIIPEDIPSGPYRIHLVLTANNDQSILGRPDGDTSYHEVTVHNNHTFLYDQIEIVCPKPAAPEGFIAQGTDTNGIGVTWTAVPDAPAYKIFRHTADDLINATLLSDNVVANSYWDNSAVPGVGYYYWVAVQNICETWSNATRLDTKATRLLMPPCIQSATDGTSTEEVQVIVERVDYANYYCFYYSTSGNPATAVQMPGECWTSDSSALHINGTPGQIYYYWAKAATSDTGDNATPLGGVCSDNMGWRKLLPPAGVSATTDLTDGVRITWPATPGAAAYRVYRNTVNDSSTAVDITGGWTEETSEYDSSGEAGRAYFYFVKAAAETNGLRPGDFSIAAVGAKAYSPAPKVELLDLGATKGTYISNVTIRWPALWPAETYYYRVYRADENNDSGDVFTAVPICDWTTGTSVEDTTAVPGRDYHYWVSSALSADGFRESAWWLCPYCFDYGWRKLSSSPDVSATDGRFGDRIRITWSPAEGATHYKVYRSTNDNYVPKIPPTLVSGVVGGTQFDDTDPSLVAKTNYYYWVTSVVNEAGDRESGFVMTGSEGWKNSAPPTRVNASDGLYTDRVRITWDLVAGLSQYQVYRNTTDNPELATALLKTWQTGNAYNDMSAVRGQLYYYWVSGRVDETDLHPSPPSEPDSGYRAFSAPAGVTAGDGEYTDKVSVSWSAATGATHYQVYRGTVNDPAAAKPLSNWQTALIYEDNSAHIGTIYFYFVASAIDDTGNFASGRGTGDSGYRALAPPVNVMATKGTYNSSVGITWEKGAPEATYFRVYRSTENDTGTVQPISNWQPELYFNDISALEGQIYYYWVCGSINMEGGGESDWSSMDQGYISLFVPGDIDGNREIQLQDAILALQVLAGITPQIPLKLEADINGDAKLSLEEAIHILQKVGNINSGSVFNDQ
jgi:fibronectin type 3 domain-containing protein